jgi:hypothetical protein
MLGWSTRKVAKQVEASLRQAPAGPVAVLGDDSLEKALEAPGREVVRVLAEPAGAAAVVSVGSPETPAALDRLLDAVREGGVVVLVEKAAPEEASRRALCATLAELEQRSVGKLVLTSGRIRRWA